MKKLIFLLAVIAMMSCERDCDKDQFVCYECTLQWETIAPEIKYPCGYSPAQIEQYRQDYLNKYPDGRLLSIECKITDKNQSQ
jgi:hypothetical protein